MKTKREGNFPKCEKCGVEFGLHPDSLGHYFVGNPYTVDTISTPETKRECLWCGKPYDKHDNTEPTVVVPKVPCLLWKGGFVEKPEHTYPTPETKREWDEFLQDGNRERPQWELDLEEYGDLHDEDCMCNWEDPDYCNCGMGGLKKIMYEARNQALRQCFNALPFKTNYIQHMGSKKAYYEGNGWDNAINMSLNNIEKLIKKETWKN